MKRQMKIAAVVSATALLAIGASFTSMAAAKTGEWKNEDGVWYCYDKNGDVYENEFCLDGGKEFYVGDNGEVVYSSWVEHDGYMYYIQSDGSKASGVWKWLTPYEDEDADEAWYWFTASGKRLDSDYVTYEGARYYFDAEGKNLTGWVDKSDYTVADESTTIENLVYCGEDGARVVKDWVKTYRPGVDVEEDDLDEESQYWYYLRSLGAPTTGKASNIEGETYFFNEDGQMLDGWIAEITDGVYAAVDGTAYKDGTSIGDLVAADKNVYFACTVDGHAKKNKWIYEWANTDMSKADPDISKNWYWVEKDGTVFVPATANNAVLVDFVDGDDNGNELVTGSDSNAVEKVINNSTYAFDFDGKMLSGFVRMNDNGGLYYYGASDDGARKTGAQTIVDENGTAFKFYFGTEDDNGYQKGVGITGAKNGKLYIDGLLKTADDAKYEVVPVELPTIATTDADDETAIYTFIVNKSGSIQTSKKVYEDDGYFVVCADDAVDHNGSAMAFETKTGVWKGSTTTLVCTKTPAEHE